MQKRQMRRNAFARKGIWNALSKNALLANALILPMVLPMLLLPGCDLFGDECSKCQDAIDHMYYKMDDFNCDKSYMAEAQERIREDCDKADFSANYIIDCLTENCMAQSLAAPLCPSPGVGIPLDVEIRYDSYAADQPLDVVVKLIENGAEVKQRTWRMEVGNVYFLEDWVWSDGDALSIQLFDTEVVPNPMTPEETFELRVRPGGTLYTRLLRFGYDATASEYFYSTIYW